MAEQMKEIVNWLRTVEEFAHKLYNCASEFFSSDEQMSRFLRRLAVDEASHYHLMASAVEFISTEKPPIPSSIKLDSVTIGHVEEPLKEAHNLLLKGTLSQRHMIESIVKAENSEWNVLFLYVINSLKNLNKLFEYGASVIQSHQDRIEQFLADHPQGSVYVDAIRQLPAVWTPRFLVVEDEQAVRDLLADLLRMRGSVATSPDGKDALERTKRHFYDVIVSDICMPKMDGIEFYTEAIRKDPTIGRRFVFCSGERCLEQWRFFQENQIPHLTKPFRVSDLMEAIEHILRESAEGSENQASAAGGRTDH